MSNIFQGDERPLRVLVCGESGIGKTTFCYKLCQQWACTVTGKVTDVRITPDQVNRLRKIELLIYVKLRDTNMDLPFADAISSQLFTQHKHYIYNLLKNEAFHSKIMLLIDDFDDVYHDVGSNLKAFAEGNLHPNISWVIMHRPNANKSVKFLASSNVKMDGLTGEKVMYYIEMYLNQKFRNDIFQQKKKLQEIANQISENPEIKQLITNPTMLQMLCMLSVKLEKLGTNRFKLLTSYVSIMLREYHDKMVKNTFVSDLWVYYKGYLLGLGQMALHGFKENHLQLVYANKDFHVDPLCFQLGFIKYLPSSNMKGERKQFKHEILQHYMAAYTIINISSCKNRYVLDAFDTFVNFCSNEENVAMAATTLDFVNSGILTKSQAIGQKVAYLMYNWILSTDMEPKKSTPMLVSMASQSRLINRLPREITMDLRIYDKSDHLLKQFFQMDSSNLKKMDITSGEHNGLDLIQNIPSLSTLEELAIDFCESETQAAESKNRYIRDMPFVSKIISNSEQMKILSLKNIMTLKETTESEVTVARTGNVESSGNNDYKNDILSHVIESGSLRRLFLSKCHFKRPNFLMLLRSIKTIEELHIVECGLSIDVETAQAVINLPPQIQVNLSKNKILPMDHQTLKQFIPKLTKQKVIDLSSLQTTLDKTLMEVVTSLPEWQKLCLSDCTFTEVNSENAALLPRVLACVNQKKSKIDLSPITTKVNKNIAKAICNLPDYANVDISGNIIDNKDVVMMLLKKAAYLKALRMSNCCVTIDKDVAEVIKSLPKFVYLNLNENPITNMDSDLLADILPHVTLDECKTTTGTVDVDLSHCHVTVDDKLAATLSKTPPYIKLNLSGNQIPNITVAKTVIRSAVNIINLKMHDCGMHINSEIAEELVNLNLSKDKLDISGNKLGHMPDSTWTKVICYMPEKIDLSELNAEIDVISLSPLSPNICHLDVSNNRIVNAKEFVKAMAAMKNLKTLKMSYCSIMIGTEMGKTLTRFSPNTNLQMIGNQIDLIDLVRGFEPLMYSTVLLATGTLRYSKNNRCKILFMEKLCL